MAAPICRIIVLFLVGLLSKNVLAQTRTNLENNMQDSRGKPDLVVCSQNLENYGLYADFRMRVRGMDESDYRKKERALINRFIYSDCDVIAVQELLGKGKTGALESLKRLADILKVVRNRTFNVLVSESNDRKVRLGFLIAEDRATLVNSVSYNTLSLPKLSNEQKPRMFSRGPFEIQLRVESRDNPDAPSRLITLINFHLKSKSTKGGQDPTGLEHEPHRMEMAEALRRIVELRHGKSVRQGRNILMLLGDRNSNFDSASARILDGTLILRYFRGKGLCRLSKRGVPLCKGKVARPRELFSLLTDDRQVKNERGTLKYGKIFSWVDDILMPQELLRFAWLGSSTEGDYDSGVDWSRPDASDHALVWAKLNW